MYRSLKPGPVSFVMRLWLEATPSGSPPQWRWHVVHVQSGQERYCHSLHDLMVFVAVHSGVPPPLAITPEGEAKAAREEGRG